MTKAYELANLPQSVKLGGGHILTILSLWRKKEPNLLRLQLQNTTMATSRGQKVRQVPRGAGICG